jgi:hypothetical protein
MRPSDSRRGKIRGLYGLRKRLRRGKRIKILLTYRCTLDCDYCTNLAASGTKPKCEEIRLPEWKRIISLIPNVREVVITGGEPMLHPDFVGLVDWLLESGKFVTVFTNLTMGRGMSISRDHQRNLRYAASYHRSFLLLHFQTHLSLYRKMGFRVDVEEIGTRMVPGSRTKDCLPCPDHWKHFSENPCGRNQLCRECVGDLMPNGVLVRGSVLDMHRYALEKYGEEECSEEPGPS